MKEQKWDDSFEGAKEVFEVTTGMPDEAEEEQETAPSSKSHITELRRRIEERLDSKRIALQFDYDDLEDELLENLQ